LGTLSLNHETTLDFLSPYTATLDLQFGFPNWRFRFGIDYSLKKLRGLSGEVQITPPEGFTQGFTAQYLFETDAINLQSSTNLLFRGVSLGLDLSYRGNQNYGAGVRVTFSLQHDSNEGKWLFRRENVTQTGAASVRVFEDLNRNGLFDEGEPPLKDTILVMNQQELDTVTDANGYAFLSGLQAHWPVDLAVSERSFRKNPFLKPSQPGVRFLPRMGKTARIEIPIWTVGAVDGTVNIATAEGELPKRATMVELRDSGGKVVKQAKTDKYGMYSFEGLAPGSYRLVISPDQLKSWNAVAEPEFEELIIPTDGTIENGKDFRLRYLPQ
jgi:hypothetical protein